MTTFPRHALAQIPHGLGGFMQGIAPVDDRLNFSFLHKLDDELQICPVWFGCQEAHFPAAERHHSPEQQGLGYLR